MTLGVDLSVRTLLTSDLMDVVALDAQLTGKTGPPKEAYWRDVFERFLRDEGCIGLAVVGETGLEGYLFGEVRAFEFGSDECGWIFALGVRPDTTRQGRASALLEESRRRFRALGVNSLRTMVSRTDVPMLSLFRDQGFWGGPFVQLELELTKETE